MMIKGKGRRKVTTNTANFEKKKVRGLALKLLIPLIKRRTLKIYEICCRIMILFIQLTLLTTYEIERGDRA